MLLDSDYSVNVGMARTADAEECVVCLLLRRLHITVFLFCSTNYRAVCTVTDALCVCGFEIHRTRAIVAWGEGVLVRQLSLGWLSK